MANISLPQLCFHHPTTTQPKPPTHPDISPPQLCLPRPSTTDYTEPWRRATSSASSIHDLNFVTLVLQPMTTLKSGDVLPHMRLPQISHHLHFVSLAPPPLTTLNPGDGATSSASSTDISPPQLCLPLPSTTDYTDSWRCAPHLHLPQTSHHRNFVSLAPPPLTGLQAVCLPRPEPQ
ncbi:hypothetical protein J6590_022888 [Homalodisca vitripennis]|nr:hypothetical protein J6590_022888 [Homalodisca vitripennis]